MAEAMVGCLAAILGGRLAARGARAIDVRRPNRAEGYLRSGKLARTSAPVTVTVRVGSPALGL